MVTERIRSTESYKPRGKLTPLCPHLPFCTPIIQTPWNSLTATTTITTVIIREEDTTTTAPTEFMTEVRDNSARERLS